MTVPPRPAAPTSPAAPSAPAPLTAAGPAATGAARKPVRRNTARTAGAGSGRGGLWSRLAGFKPRFRLLPVTIFVAMLMLGMRLGDVWQTLVVGKPLSSVVPPSHAQTAPPAAAGGNKASLPTSVPANLTQPVRVAAKVAEEKKTDEKKDGAPTAKTGSSKETTGKDAAPPVPASGEADSGRPLVLGSKERVGPAEVELLQHLGERRTELDRRARELEQREALLVAAEQRFDQKATELQKLREEIQGLLKTVDDKQAAQLESLVKIYETMKPKEAARIFEALDLPVLLNVMERMKETKTAPILAAMDPVKAKEVTVALVDRRQLPQVPAAGQ